MKGDASAFTDPLAAELHRYWLRFGWRVVTIYEKVAVLEIDDLYGVPLNPPLTATVRIERGRVLVDGWDMGPRRGPTP
jgi:hypothetical protein